jgi:hypothetical protein
MSNTSVPRGSYAEWPTQSAATRHPRVRNTAQVRRAATVPAKRESQRDDTVGTIGAAAASPEPYSPEWWAQERAREEREDERLRRVMRICQAC